MARGRKRKPVELHVVTGTYRAHRHGAKTSPKSDAPPTAPAELSDREREHFAEVARRLEEIGIASASHERAISLAAKRMAEIEKCDEAIEAHGLVYLSHGKNDGELVKPNPAVRMRSEAMRHLHALLAELGLTPASASKVAAKKKEAKANPFLEESG